MLLRSLCALEAVLGQGSSQACGEVAVMFQSDPGPVVKAAGAAQPAAVRERASRCLALLLGEDYHVHGPPPACASPPPPHHGLAAASAVVQQQPDLLDLLGGGVDVTPTGGGPGDDLWAAAPMTMAPSAAAPGYYLAPVAPQQQATFDPFYVPPAVPAVQQTAQPAGPSFGSSTPQVIESAAGIRPPLDDFFSSLAIAPAPMAAPPQQQNLGLSQPLSSGGYTAPAQRQQPPGQGNTMYGGGGMQQAGAAWVGGAAGFGVGPAAWSPLPAAGLNQPQSSNSLSDSKAFDFLKDHLK